MKVLRVLLLLHLLSTTYLSPGTKHSARLPMISSRLRKGVINRDRVRQFQIQSIFKTMNAQDAFTREILHEVTREVAARDIQKRDLNTQGSENMQPSTNGHSYSEQMPWDIVKRQVPFRDLLERNSASRANSINPLKSSESSVKEETKDFSPSKTVEKRNLLTPSEDVNEDVQPVEIVKIEKLVIQNGIIRDQNIIEKAMFV